jgi:hypothetical protein
MILLQTVLAFAARSVGRVVNTAMGWATTLLFGKVPQEKQIYLSVVEFGSLVWIVAALGVLFPSLATFVIAFVTLPKWVHPVWIRIAMLVGALAIPPIVGESAIRTIQGDVRPRGADRIARAVLSGYRLTLGIALAILTVIFIAPAMYGRNLLRRWKTRHIPLVVHHDDYGHVVDDIQRTLIAAGIPVERWGAGGMLLLPTRLLTFATGGVVPELKMDRLTGERLELILYPFDLMLSGGQQDVIRAQAAVAERLPLTKAYLTWSRQANELEDHLKQVWSLIGQRAGAGNGERGGRGGAEITAEIDSIRRQLQLIPVSYEEWEILGRETVMLERDLLRQEIAAAAVDRTDPIPQRGAERRRA